MIGFKKYLSEVFNKPLPYTHKGATGDSNNYIFSLPDTNDKIAVSIRKTFGNRSVASDKYEISFLRDSNDKLFFKMTNDNKYQIVIMSTVVDIVRNHFKAHPVKYPDYVEFTAKINDRGRVALYRRIARGLAKEIGGEVIESSLWTDIQFVVIPKN